MSKNENTILALEAALNRILQGKPKRILATRKLSVRAVEEESNLGNGSCYYYPNFVKKIKQLKAEASKERGEYFQPEIQSVRSKLVQQKRIKQNYKEKYELVKNQLAIFSASQHHLNDKLIQALAKIDDLEYENTNLKEELIKLKRSNIISIN